MRLIPAIDLRGGRCVRLLRGDFAAETAYDVEPAALLQRYRAAGAEWLHVVDLDGARDGARAHRELIGELAALRALRLQVGGGIRDREAVLALRGCGVDRVVVGSAAITDPDAVRDWLGEFGPASLVLALDLRFD